MDTLRIAARLPITTIALDYARLSKDKRKLSENVGIQHKENLGFIEDQEWQYGRSYKDNDISASRFGRKTRDEYLRMIEDIKSWPDEPGTEIKIIIVVTEMPRLYRQVEELLPLIRMAESTKLSGIWTTDGDGYDLSTPEGIHRAIGAVNNAMLESNRASKRQLRKKKSQASQGKYMGGQRRYGFEGAIKDEHGNITNRDRINVAEIPEEVERWLDWYNRLLASETQSSIIKNNNKRGIPTPQGKIGKWTVGNFKRLMTNEAFVIFDATSHPGNCPCLENRADGGTLVHRTSGTKHRSQHRGFITPDEHEVLLATFDARGQTRQHNTVKGRKYLLSSILRCGGTYNGQPCMVAMYGNGRTYSAGYQRRYTCRTHNNQLDRVACGKVFRDAAAVDEWVIEQVIQRLDTPQVTSALVPKEDNQRAAELTRAITALRKRRDLIKRQYARGEIEELADYKLMASEIDTAIEENQTKLGKLRTAKASNLLPADGNVRQAFAGTTIEWQRSVISLVVDHIIVHPADKKTRNSRHFNSDLIEIVWRELAAVEASMQAVIRLLETALQR